MLRIVHSTQAPRPTLAQLRYRAEEADLDGNHDELVHAEALIAARTGRPRTANPFRVVQ